MSLRSWLGITKGRERRVKKGKKIFIICLYLMAIIGSIAFIFPFIWVVSTSLKETAQTYTFPPELIPDPVSWRNYYRIWTEIPFSLFYRNSLFVILTAPLGAVITTSLVAYPFARLRFRGRNFLFILILSTLMVPPQILIIPRFLLFKSIGWLDTLKPLIIPYCLAGAPGAAFNIFLFRQFYMTIPFELDEAAKIDGASSFGIYWRIIFPLSRPAFFAILMLSILGHWNKFIEPLVYLNSTNKFTLPLGLNFLRASFQTGGEPMQNLFMAGVSMASLPMIILFLILQRYFVRGIAITGVKG